MCIRDRVAGAVLYPKEIPTVGNYQLPCWIRNMRILDRDNCLPEEVYPPRAIAVSYTHLDVYKRQGYNNRRK